MDGKYVAVIVMMIVMLLGSVAIRLRFEDGNVLAAWISAWVINLAIVLVRN